MHTMSGNARATYARDRETILTISPFGDVPERGLGGSARTVPSAYTPNLEKPRGEKAAMRERAVTRLGALRTLRRATVFAVRQTLRDHQNVPRRMGTSRMEDFGASGSTRHAGSSRRVRATGTRASVDCE